MMSVHNSNVDPRNDYYKFKNQEWLKNNPIPDDKNRWGQFNILAENNKERVKKLVENSLNSKDDQFKKIGVLYNQGIDENSRNTDEYKIFLEKIDNIKDKKDLMSYIYESASLYQFLSPLDLSSYSDFSDSKNNILHIFTSGLILPDRDYFFLEGKENIRQKFKEFIQNYSKLFNVDVSVENVFNFLKVLAKHTYTKTQKRDPNLLNNPTTLEEINVKYPNLLLPKFFSFYKIKPGKINVSNPKYLKKLDEMLQHLDLNIWKDYFKLSFLLSVGNYISMEAEEMKFNFFSKDISGTLKMEKLWKRSINNVEKQLGHLIGKLYVSKFFPEESKKIANNMIKFIKGELRSKLKTNDWMEEKTKKMAIDKIDKMNVKIGYPNKWKSYEGLKISSKNSYFKNNLSSNKFEVLQNLDEVYKPRDNSKWFMFAHQVNAYYSPSFNEIVFPAGILQAPFFDKDYDIELNFGGIGSVIGHEMTHGFDDQGCKFDGNGNLFNWWTDNDRKEYRDKTKLIEDQYSKYVIEGRNLKGKLTLGENIADLGGVSISLKALESYYDGKLTKDELCDAKKKFFGNYATIWRCNTRKKEILKRVIEDPHSPPVFRVNGVLSNLTDFYECYNLNKQHKLWRDQSLRAKIW
jgi:putative endopeptidase